MTRAASFFTVIWMNLYEEGKADLWCIINTYHAGVFFFRASSEQPPRNQFSFPHILRLCPPGQKLKIISLSLQGVWDCGRHCPRKGKRCIKQQVLKKALMSVLQVYTCIIKWHWRSIIIVSNLKVFRMHSQLRCTCVYYPASQSTRETQRCQCFCP